MAFETIARAAVSCGVLVAVAGVAWEVHGQAVPTSSAAPSDAQTTTPPAAQSGDAEAVTPPADQSGDAQAETSPAARSGALSTSVPATASGKPAPDPKNASPLTWNPQWPRFRPVGYGLTAIAVGGALAATFLIPYPHDPRWTGGILFDDAIRKGLRARDPGARDAIRLASDITLVTTIVHEALVDSILIPLSDQSPEVAWQLSLMNAQAYSLNILFATVLFKVAARARPTYQQCQSSNGSFDPLCKASPYASFPSSHASTAFTAAGLTCVHHQFLPIYGGGPWDTTACISSLVFATATATFRVVGDRHYATDVIVGAAVGFSLGYIYPWLLHYRGSNADSSARASAGSSAGRSASHDDVHWGIVPGAGGAGPYGLSMIGMF